MTPKTDIPFCLSEKMGEGHQATKREKLPAEPELSNEPQDNLGTGADSKQVAPGKSFVSLISISISIVV